MRRSDHGKIEKMRYRLKTKKGRAIYNSRKETVVTSRASALPTWGLIRRAAVQVPLAM